MSLTEKKYKGNWYDLKSVKKAERKDRDKPMSEMLLMMFRSAARDRKTHENTDNPELSK